MEKEFTEVYCGGGKGKTTLAIGQCLRASAQGKSVIIIQFLKGRERRELDFLEELDNLDIKIFRFEKHDEGYEELNEQEKAEEKTNILNALNFARKVIATQECDFLLLDEILALPDYGITTAEAIGDILKMKDSELRHIRGNEISMIFQDPMASLNERAKVDYIISEGLYNFNLFENEADRKAKVSRVMQRVGLLPEFASRFPHEFSGGQRQRIGIARALIMEPEFIIADEPISALDVSIRAQIINLLNELKKEHSLTYLFIAHDLSVVRFISDRIGVIYKGALMELAPGEEIFAHPLHPYTRSLLSAIPMPDPAAERGKTCTPYNPSVHDYSVDKPAWTEIAPGHFVFANARECDEYRRMLG
mgnify:CR=1 FL=1